jgi:hypothetical protein
VAKTLFYRWFGVGKVPADTAADLEREGVLLLDEGFPGSATFRNFRAPGQYSSGRRVWYTAAIALTKERVLGLRYSKPVIDVPWADERLRRVTFSLDGDEVRLAAFDASLFHDD